MKDKVLIMCEIEQEDAIKFLSKGNEEGVTFSEKRTNLIKNFLPKGDNHLLGETA